MITIDGKRFRTLQDKIYANGGVQIVKVFAGDTQVYPGLPHRALCTGSYSIDSKAVGHTVDDNVFEGFTLTILFTLLLESDEPFSFEKNSDGSLILLDRFGNQCSAYTDQYFHFDATGSIHTTGAPTASNVLFGSDRWHIGPFFVAVDANDFRIFNTEIMRLSGVVSGRDSLEKRRIVVPDDDSEYELDPSITGLSVPYSIVYYGGISYGSPPSIYIHSEGLQTTTEYNTPGYRRAYSLASRFSMFGGVPNMLGFSDLTLPCNVVALGSSETYDCVNSASVLSRSVPSEFRALNGDRYVELTDYQFL